MFIVIDGIDGSGKTTQIERIKSALEETGKTVKIYDFPRYGNPSSFFVEQYLSGKYGENLNPKLSSLFYALDRFDCKDSLQKDRENFDYILSNRYTSANMIHQGGKIKSLEERKNFLDWVDDLEHNICDIPKPDRVFFLNVSPETSLKLIEKRGNPKDIHENDSNHLSHAYDSAKSLAKLYDNWTEIDCEKSGEILSREEITDMILKEIL